MTLQSHFPLLCISLVSVGDIAVSLSLLSLCPFSPLIYNWITQVLASLMVCQPRVTSLVHVSTGVGSTGAGISGKIQPGGH